jgi:hypothetical protein
VSERPTARPPFDPAQFAQEAESRLGHAEESPASRKETPRAFPRPSLAVTSRPKVREAGSARWPKASDNLDGKAVPLLAMSRQELEWFALSPSASRLIAQVDGLAAVETICSRAELPCAEGTLILLELSDQGIVTFLEETRAHGLR